MLNLVLFSGKEVELEVNWIGIKFFISGILLVAGFNPLGNLKIPLILSSTSTVSVTKKLKTSSANSS